MRGRLVASREKRETERKPRSFPGCFRVFVRLKYVPSHPWRATVPREDAAANQGKGRKWRREAVARRRRRRRRERSASCLASRRDAEIRAESIRDVTARADRAVPEAPTKNTPTEIMGAPCAHAIPKRRSKILRCRFPPPVAATILRGLEKKERRINARWETRVARIHETIFCKASKIARHEYFYRNGLYADRSVRPLIVRSHANFQRYNLLPRFAW